MNDDMKRVGLIFKADGAVDFKKSISSVNTALKENQSEFAVAKSLWDDSTKSMDKLTDRQEYLSKQTKTYKDKVEKLNNVLKTQKELNGENSEAVKKTRLEINKAKEKLNYYQKGLDGVNKELKAGVANLKEYSKKLKQTGKDISDTGDKLTKGVTLPILAVGAASEKAFSEIDKGYDTIVKKTGATGDELEKLKGNFENVYGNFAGSSEEVSNSISDVSTRFGFTGDTLEEASVAFLKFAKINETDVSTSISLVSRAMGDSSIDSSEYANILDQLTAASQASGIAIDVLTNNLTKYGAPMRALGFDTKESIALFSTWEKAGVNTEIAFSGMKKAISNWSKEGKDARVEFSKTLDQIESAPDIATATGIAIETFGSKAGPDLADAIQGGRFAVDELMSVIESSGGTLNTTYENIEGPQEKLKETLNELTLTGAELGNTLNELLIPILEKLGTKIKEFNQWFTSLDENQKKMIVEIALIVAAIGPVLLVVGKVITSVGFMIDIFTAIATFMSTVLIPILTTTAFTIGAVTIPVWAVVAAIAAAIAIGVALYKNWDTIVAKAGELASGINNKFKEIQIGITDKINSAKDAVKEAVDKMKNFFKFKWDLPHMNLPHFSVKGNFSLKPPSVPHFDVKWFANGGIFDRPTLFDSPGGVKGVGEAGPEAVIPIKKLKLYLSEVLDSKFGNTSVDYNDIFENSSFESTIYRAFVKALEEMKFSVNSREFARLVRENQ